MKIKVTPKQKSFLDADADEVLFGGAAGGGKSYGQIIDAFLYALKNAGSKQLILRRTFPELEKSLIRVSLELYPKEVYTYNNSNHTGRFKNGSIIDFGYCDNERDVYKYQSAEYDTIRFDELTHFTETMYTYLISRLRGANSFKKQVKSSTNPGGVGHQWVKDRFVDPAPPGETFETDHGTRVFLPSLVADNSFLMEADPDYIKRLKNLPENQKRALLYGNWDIFEGTYFNMWNPEIHTVPYIPLPSWWRRYVTMDYGRDMFAAYFVAVDEIGNAYVYKEIYQSGLLVTEAAQRLKEITTEPIEAYYAPPDLWNKHSDTGRSTAEIMADQGIMLVKANNDRVQGWYDLAEWLKPIKDEQGQTTARLKIFESCRNLIRTLPALQYDERNPNDTAREPHELTHAPDAIRYFVAGRPAPAEIPIDPEEVDEEDLKDEIDDFLSFGQ